MNYKRTLECTKLYNTMRVFILIDTWRGNHVMCVCNTLELANETLKEFAEVEGEKPDNGRLKIKTTEMYT